MPSQELWGGSNPLHTSSQLSSAHTCTCKPFSVCLCTTLCMCNSERFPAFTVCLQLPDSPLCMCVCVCVNVNVHVCLCVKDSEMVLRSALWWLNGYPAALCIGSPRFNGEKPWFHIAAIWAVMFPSQDELRARGKHRATVIDEVFRWPQTRQHGVTSS